MIAVLTALLAVFPASSADGAELSKLLEASGEGTRLAHRLHQALDEVARVARRAPLPDRGATVLRALHRDLLRRYDERATTLGELLEDGRFNCVSSTAVYALAADRLGLEFEIELLPTHVRVRVRTGGDWQVVETTSPAGFGATHVPRMLVAGSRGRALVDEVGVRGGLELVASAMWVNRAALAQERGEVARAERWFAKAEASLSQPSVRAALRDQRASLLLRLAVEDADAGRLFEARQRILRALELRPRDRPIDRALRDNLAAVTERIIRSAVAVAAPDRARRARREVAPWLTVDRRRRLAAFELTERARFRLESGDVLGALDLVEQATGIPLDPEHRELGRHIEAQLARLAPAAAEVHARAGRLAEAERVLSMAMDPGSPSGRHARLRLARIAGQFWLTEGETDRAVTDFRRGLAAVPDDPDGRRDLVVALHRAVEPFVEAGQCESALEIFGELRGLGRVDLAREAEVRCRLRQASTLWEQGELDRAKQALERAAATAPEDDRWRPPMAGLLRALVDRRVADGHCRDARKLALELARVAGERVSIAPCP